MLELRIVSNIFFWSASFVLIIGVILLEIGTRYMRNGKDSKRKMMDRIAIKFMLVAAIMYLTSLLFALV